MKSANNRIPTQRNSCGRCGASMSCVAVLCGLAAVVTLNNTVQLLIISVQQKSGSSLPWSPNFDKVQGGSSMRPNQPAFDESLGFFDDIPARTWARMKEKVTSTGPNTNGSPYGGKRNIVGWFYQNHYEPDFVCQHERRVGRLGDGGKWICDPHRISESEKCLVYSIGSNNDFSFEHSVQRDIGFHCDIHTFDPADYSERARENNVTYHQWGISGTNFRNRRGQSFKTLEETVKELGHVNRTIDIFKIDCEGCEWDSYRSWLNAPVVLRQVQVEVHDVNDKTPGFFEQMYHEGYVIFHKEPNIQFWRGSLTRCIEYAFLKLHPSFLKGRASNYEEFQKHLSTT